MNSNIVLMDREELAAMIGVHTETIRRAQHAGKLPAYILGQKLVRYDLADVQAWLKGTRYEGNPPLWLRREEKHKDSTVTKNN